MPVKSEIVMKVIELSEALKNNIDLLSKSMPTVTSSANGLYEASKFKYISKILNNGNNKSLAKIVTINQKSIGFRIKIIEASSSLKGELNLTASTNDDPLKVDVRRVDIYGKMKVYINRNEGSIFVELDSSQRLCIMTLYTNLEDYIPEIVPYNIEGLEEIQ